MIYVFTFLGEFGYELLNWQGVVRKFAASVNSEDIIIACGRPDLHPMYETASQYIDISDLDLFRKSRACGYYAIRPNDTNLRSRRNLKLDSKLIRQIEAFVLERLAKDVSDKDFKLVFSSRRTVMGDCVFGADRGGDSLQGEGDIYYGLNLANNDFKKLKPELALREAIQESLGMDLGEPFVLCQARRREIVVRSGKRVRPEHVLEKLADRIRVILLSFETGRKNDSYSRFEDIPNCLTYRAKSLASQSCLIHFARHSLFFSEGDFGSHIYVPPFFGRDVTAVVPGEIFNLGTTPIDFWNKNVFRFGGQVIPEMAEDVLASDAAAQDFLQEVIARSSSQISTDKTAVWSRK